jgi:hypothetical protein
MNSSQYESCNDGSEDFSRTTFLNASSDIGKSGRLFNIFAVEAVTR